MSERREPDRTDSPKSHPSASWGPRWLKTSTSWRRSPARWARKLITPSRIWPSIFLQDSPCSNSVCFNSRFANPIMLA